MALVENRAARDEATREMGFEPIEWEYECELNKPSTRRIDIAFSGASGSWHPTRSQPRLTLQTHNYRRTAVDAIMFCDNSFFEVGKGYKPAVELCRRVCTLGTAGGRAGTWERYLQEVENARAIIRDLGWHLTQKEQRLIEALEEYGRRAPAGRRTAKQETAA